MRGKVKNTVATTTTVEGPPGYDSPEKLWGRRAIAQALGLWVETTRRLAEKQGGRPIYRPAGRYVALRSEINAWLRSKETG